ncbi:hypothetical protein [Winogradskyella aurantiaca]|uniref:hypothetical protein n=1 Tax=Winogradskyella aurantiaca TaxID=2219558 RepID=UPI000E1DE870|nr:hypothetical protein [Winogradskyella aurantiaca]
MKPSQIFILLISFYLIVSCSSSDDSNPDEDFNMVGVWQGVAVDFDTSAVVEIAGEQIPVICDGEGFDVNFLITFTDGPNEYSADGTFSVLNECTLIGEQVQEDLEVFGDGSWVYENGNLSMTENGETITVDVEIISNDRIILEFEEEIVLEEGPISANGTVDIEIELSRL